MTKAVSFQDMIDDAQSLIGDKIDGDWKRVFGSAVLISVPRDNSSDHANVTGWVSHEESHKPPKELLGMAFASFCGMLLASGSAEPSDLLNWALDAIVHIRVGNVIVMDDDDDKALN